jgi:hypothetical protein
MVEGPVGHGVVRRAVKRIFDIFVRVWRVQRGSGIIALDATNRTGVGRRRGDFVFLT